MSEQPTHTPAAALRAELARRGLTITADGAARAREQLTAARAAWPTERFAAVRARSQRAARRSPAA